MKLWPRWFRVVFLVLLGAMVTWGMVSIIRDSIRTGTLAISSYAVARGVTALLVPLVVLVGALVLLGLRKLRQRRR